MIVLGILCALGLLLIPFAKQRQWFRPQPNPIPVTASEAAYVPGLSLAESALDPQTRSYKGLVKNDSDRAFHNVEIFYDARDQTGELVDVLVAKVGLVGPHQSAKFETGVAPQNATGFGLREITGNPQ